MRFLWIVFILSMLLSMGLLVIIMGQYQVKTMLNKGGEKMHMEAERLDNELMNEDLFKTTVEKLVAQGTTVVKDLEATVTTLGPEMEKKKTKNEACQAEKKTLADELAVTEKEHKETEATLKAESDVWNQEIHTLKAQLMEYREICNYVRKEPLALVLCGKNTTEPL